MSNAHAQPDEAETAAFRLVPLHSGATLEPYDHSGRQGAVDALLHFPDGRTAALEVTSAAATGQRQLDSIRRRSDLRPTNPGRWTWIARVRTPQDFADLKAHAERTILRCEELGLDDAAHLVGDPDFDWLVHSTATLRRGPGSPKTGQPLIVLPEMTGGGRNEGPRDFEDAVEKMLDEGHIAKRMEKLLRSGYVERHLFILVDESGLPDAAHHALRTNPRVPLEPVQLPLGVTHLWLSVAFAHRVLLATVDGWQSFADTSPPTPPAVPPT